MKISLFLLLPIFLISGFVIKISSNSADNAVHITSYDIKNPDSIMLNSRQKGDKTTRVKLGIDVLEYSNFQKIKGKNIGLITNQTGVNSDLKSTIDILNESMELNLIALFGPEHGVRGDVEGGKHITFYKDPKTNLPVYSLYGTTKRPNFEMLKDLDVLVYDIQDIGVRSYTFISTMGLAMESASENNLEFVILDRPNPLGGEKVEGNLVDEDYRSFISQFDIPYVYGLTCGELAKLLVGEKMVNVSPDFNPEVVEMGNWQRSMLWEETGLQWIPTSPHIPNQFSAVFYPMTGILGELRSAISIGVGYTLPFQIVGAEWIDSYKLIDQLSNYQIPGLIFRPITFQPYYAFGMGEILSGVQIHISDYGEVDLIKTQFYIIDALRKIYPENNLLDSASEREIVMFNKAVGTDRIFSLLEDGRSLDEIFDYLDKDIDSFKEISKKYYLYK
jgi:uncharacterized protein YbbC (DUF1343 family)